MTATRDARVLRRADPIGPRPGSHCRPHIEGMTLAMLQPAPPMRREVAPEASCGHPAPGGLADSARVGRHLCGAQFPLLPDPGSSGFHLKTLFGVESGTVDRGAEPQTKTGSPWSRSGGGGSYSRFMIALKPSRKWITRAGARGQPRPGMDKRSRGEPAVSGSLLEGEPLDSLMGRLGGAEEQAHCDSSRETLPALEKVTRS